MNTSVISVVPSQTPAGQSGQLFSREWLVTNGLGGYTSGSVAGVCTRRYHGLLISALPAPIGRTVMLSHLAEAVRLPDGRLLRLSGEQRAQDTYDLPEILTEFSLEMGLPVWRYDIEGLTLEKRILMPYGQNTVHITYRVLKADSRASLVLRPRLSFRGHEAPVSEPCEEHMEIRAAGRRYELHSPSRPDIPPLRMTIHGSASGLLLDGGSFSEFFYRIESSRGYPDRGHVWSPGHFQADLGPGDECTLIASTEDWNTVSALAPEQAQVAEQGRRQRLLQQAPAGAQVGMAAQLVLAADQFIITPFSRQGDGARAHAEGDQARTVIAGYHWFTDWGRDTMISLEGLTLATGRHAEAGYILRTFLHYVKDGLIPNMFPEGKNKGLYHTADATLWFFHAMDRYVRTTGDRTTLALAMPVFTNIIDHHVQGTRFGIGVDASDGLLRQGADGYQLTWMDAKVEGWVVTPRRGKAVELNALFYNALCLMQQWMQEHGDDAGARRMAQHAALIFESFNARFWNPDTACLFDVVDGEGGDDPAIRPNMLLAISLPNAVLDRSHWESVLEVAERQLLTPVGLRSLAPGHADYKATYDGDLRARDAAYHQGTVWGWLIGPFIDAWLKVYPGDKDGARGHLYGIGPHVREACVGSISEIFDAKEPFTPRGCVAQAWSVAEVLRVTVKLATSPEQEARAS